MIATAHDMVQSFACHGMIKHRNIVSWHTNYRSIARKFWQPKTQHAPGQSARRPCRFTRDAEPPSGSNDEPSGDATGESVTWQPRGSDGSLKWERRKVQRINSTSTAGRAMSEKIKKKMLDKEVPYDKIPVSQSTTRQRKKSGKIG